MSERVKRDYIDPHESIWLDPDGTLHLDAVKLCKAHGYPATKENQDMVEAAAREVFGKEFPAVPLSVRNDLL